MAIYKRAFRERVIERNGVKIHEHLRDVIDTEVNLSTGDMIMYTNEYGVTFGPHQVLGFCEPDEYGRCIYFDHDAYWFPAKIHEVQKITL